MWKEDKAAAACLHSDTLTGSWENISAAAPNRFASWAKPLYEKYTRNSKAIHYGAWLIVIGITLDYDKWDLA